MAYLAHSPSRQGDVDIFLGFQTTDIAQLKSVQLSRAGSNINAVVSAAIPANIPKTVKNLHLVLGSDFANEDEEALSLIVDHTKRKCIDLKRVHVQMHVDSWTSHRDSIISGWHSHPLERFEYSLVEPTSKSQVVTRETTKNQEETRFKTLGYFPVGGVPEVFDPKNAGIWNNLQDLTLFPSTTPLTPTTIYNIVIGWSLTTQLKNLRKIVIPLDFRGYLTEILRSLSVMPQFRTLILLPPSSFSLRREISEQIVTELLDGLERFHHLRQLTLPLDLISKELLDCVAGLLGLRTLAFSSAMSRIEQIHRSATIGGFPSLRRLKMSGSLSDLANVISACVYPGTSVLTEVSIKVNSLRYAGEMRESLQVLAHRCELLKKFCINIKHVHAMENANWMDLTSLPTCRNLQQFIISHPRPLPITDVDILHFLCKCRGAKNLSLNPRPSLPEWRVTTRSPYRMPTLTCLEHLINEGHQLDHFGVYLNTSLGKTVPGLFNVGLKELDMGGSYRRKATTKSIRTMFPNAAIM